MKTITEEQLKLLENNLNIIYAVLNRCHIYPSHPDYDDYLQLGRLIFLSTLLTYPKPYNTLDQWHTFVGYVSQQIYWRFIDELRRQPQNKYDILSLNSDYLAHNPDPAGEDFIHQLETKEQLQLLMNELTYLEQHLLRELINHDLTVNAYAKKFKIPRSTAYKRRQSIQNKYRDLLASQEN